jgi:hypothetical protein
MTTTTTKLNEVKKQAVRLRRPAKSMPQYSNQKNLQGPSRTAPLALEIVNTVFLLNALLRREYLPPTLLPYLEVLGLNLEGLLKWSGCEVASFSSSFS